MRRNQLMQRTQRRALIMIPSANLVIRNGDAHFPFRQSSDFYYLTGFNEPDAMALLAPGHPEGEYILFNRPRDPEREIWYGERVGQQGAINTYFADQAYDIQEFWKLLPIFLGHYEIIIWPIGHNPPFDQMLFAAIADLKHKKAPHFPSIFQDLTTYTQELRLIKSTEELAMIRRAVAISIEGHLACLQQAQAGMYEYELEAFLMHAFYRHGSRAPAYNAIVGTGRNSCILHYHANNQRLQSGDLVLIDAGAEFEGYAADITRTFPVNKTFSPEQRAIYAIVYEAQQAVIRFLKPGVAWEVLQACAVEHITRGLCELGILSGTVSSNIEQKHYRQFYMHQAGHWLGLDVHDVGTYHVDGQSRLLQPGMVLTVEPGIYIMPHDRLNPKWWHIGIRIEDDVLITPQGCEVLSAALPKTIDEIEAIRRS